MTTGIGSSMFLNLPISDVAATRTFWAEVGVPISENHSDDNALALAFSEHVVAGLMYGRTFDDPDGHHWEMLWMSSEMPPG